MLEVEREKNGARAVVLRKSKEGVDGMRWPFLLKAVPLGTDEDGDPLSSCVVAPDVTARRAERRPHLTPSQEYGLASLKAALQEAGDDAVHIDVWRRHFYARSTADNTEAKRKAFGRARESLVSLGVIIVQDDMYSVPSGTGGTERDNCGTCPGGHPPSPGVGQPGHTPLGVSRSDVPVPGGVRGLLPGVPEQGAGQAQCPGAGGQE